VPTFDYLMLLIGGRLGIGPLDDVIMERAKARVDRYRKQRQEILRAASAPVATAPADRKQLAAFAVGLTFNRATSWWAWELKASQEPDPTKREKIYRDAEKKYPNSADLLGNFAAFMADDRKDDAEAERLYRRALELDPNRANSTGI